MIRKTLSRTALWSAAVGSAALCALGAAAQAADVPAGSRSITVNYHDLDLSTLHGALVLYQRLQSASRHVCEGSQYGLYGYYEWQACYRAALADAVAKVNSPLLTAAQRDGGKPGARMAMLTK